MSTDKNKLIPKKRVRLKNRDKSRDYVDGKTFHNAIVAWYASDKDEIPLVIANAVMQICQRLGTKYNFVSYTYNDEMVGDGIEACIKALNDKKYDAAKYDNPFAYFTRVAWNAFVAVINKEHKEAYVKHKSLANHYQDMALNGEDITEVPATDELNIELIHKFESKHVKPPKRKKVKKSLDEFLV